jgi:ribosome-binding protein aMBF1 (putative translation factor)
MGNLNKTLRLKIIEHFDTQSDLAQAAKEDETFFSKVIRGRRVPDQQKAKKWARLLGCRVNDLFGKDVLSI